MPTIKKTKSSNDKNKKLDVLKQISEYGVSLDEDNLVDSDELSAEEEEYEKDEGVDEVDQEEDKLGDNVTYEGGEDMEAEAKLEEEEADQEDVPDEVSVGSEQAASEEDGCLYNFSKKKMTSYESDEDYEDDEIYDDEVAPKYESKIITGDDRITGNVMTKYERVRVIAIRSKQLMLGAKPMLKNTDRISPKDIARMELEKGIVPFKIRRERPDGLIEEWKISELVIIN